jgi:hypothetical protein
MAGNLINSSREKWRESGFAKKKQADIPLCGFTAGYKLHLPAPHASV